MKVVMVIWNRCQGGVNVTSSELSGMIEGNVNPSIQFRERIKSVYLLFSK